MTDATTSNPPAPLAATMESLLGAISAFKNIRALVLLGLTFIVSVLIGGLFTLLAVKTGFYSFYAIAWLLGFATLFYGVNGVGILLMNDAQGNTASSIVDAVLLSLYTSHRLLAVLILDVLIVLAVVVAVALVLLICKIPVLGPFLFTFVFPISAVVLGVLVFALYFVMLPLAAPAVWSGSGVFQVIARINTVIRHQLLNVLLAEFILLLITGFVGSVIAMIVAAGSTMTSGMSAGIIGFGVGGDFTNLLYGLSGNGHMMAAAIGGGLLFAVAGVIPTLIWTKGICLIYLNNTRGLDFSKAEAQLNSRVDGVRKKAEDARNRARDLAAQHMTEAAPVVTPACPSCEAVIADTDVFCGNCGHKLK